MCELLHLMETEHGIKTAKHPIRHTEKWLHAGHSALCFIIFFAVITNFAIDIEIYWIYRRELELNPTNTERRLRLLLKRKKHFDAFIFARNGISIYGLWSQAFYAIFQVFGAKEINSLQFYDGRRIKILFSDEK